MSFFGKRKDSQPLLFLMEPFSSLTLVTGSFKRISSLPAGIDCEEWMAAHTVDFVNFTQLFYSSISEYCDPVGVMGAGGVDYQWKNADASPAQYCDSALAWMQAQVNDESLFPTRQGISLNEGQAFPKEFIVVVRAIFKQLVRILSYIYYEHYERILHLSSEAHLNTLFAHLICFAMHFELMERKELEPMRQLIQAYEQAGRI